MAVSFVGEGIEVIFGLLHCRPFSYLGRLVENILISEATAYPFGDGDLPSLKAETTENR